MNFKKKTFFKQSRLIFEFLKIVFQSVPHERKSAHMYRTGTHHQTLSETTKIDQICITAPWNRNGWSQIMYLRE